MSFLFDSYSRCTTSLLQRVIYFLCYIYMSPMLRLKALASAHHVLGAPPIVASGSRSMVYLCACRYMTGTPGICKVQIMSVLR